MSGDILVFDTGPLSHFARQSWLGVLKAVTGERTALIPDVVAAELAEDAIAVVDDSAARKAADTYKVQICPTLALLCEAIRTGLLTIGLVSALADDLLADEYRLPFAPGDFARWARSAEC